MRAGIIAGLLLISLLQAIPKQANKPRPNQEAGQQTPEAAPATPTVRPSPDPEQSRTNNQTKETPWCEQLLSPVVSNWPLIAVAIWGILVARSTLHAIKWQAEETAKATKAMNDSLPLQKSAADAALLNAQAVINAERAWLDIDLRRTGKSSYEFRITNHGRTPAFVIWRMLGRTYWDDGIGEIPVGFVGTHREARVLNNISPADGKDVNIFTFDVSIWPPGEDGQSVTYHGQIRYRDIFNQVHRTEVVYSFQQSTLLLVYEPLYTKYVTETEGGQPKKAN